MSYKSGWGAVKEAAERSQVTFSGPQTRMISWTAGEKKLIRLLEDSPIVIGMHQYVSCLDGKKRNFVCARELAEPRECYICENFTRETKSGTVPLKPTTIGLCSAVVRKEVRNGRSLEAHDELVDIVIPDEEGLEDELKAAGVKVEDGKAIGVPDVGIVIQSVGNFWSNFNAYYARYGTAIDRDYEVSRQGERLNTKYVIIPTDPDGRNTEEEIEKDYAVSKLLRTGTVEYIERLGSEGYYERHLIAGPSESSEASPPKEEEPADEGEPITKNETEFSSLSDRLKRYKKS